MLPLAAVSCRSRPAPSASFVGPAWMAYGWVCGPGPVLLRSRGGWLVRRLPTNTTEWLTRRPRVQMVGHRARPRHMRRPGGRPGPPPPPPQPPLDPRDGLERAIRGARDAWRAASRGQRFSAMAIAALAAAGGAALIGTALQLAAFAAVFVLPLLMFPVFLLVASFGAVALGMFTVAGASVMFVGAPVLLGGAFVLKALAPYAGLAFLALKARHMLETDTEVATVIEDPVEESEGIPYDSLSEFDQKLAFRERAARTVKSMSSPSSRLVDWSTQDCVDELYAQGLSPFVVVFMRERIDGHVLSIMSDAEIEAELCGGMPLGDRKRFIAWVRRFRV